MEEKQLLSLIEYSANMSVTDLAMALNESEDEVAQTVKELEEKGVICGYHTLINWSKTDSGIVEALIQVRANPERDYGYDRIAKKIYQFPEVDSMYLVSGDYEFMVTIKGRTMQEVSRFVGSKLAPIEGVIGTATLFVLKHYKKDGICLDDDTENKTERLLVTP